MNNVVEIKIKLHSKYTNRTWVGKLTDQKINQQTIFVYDPYLKTTKLWYWFITLILIYKLIAGNMSSLNCKQKLRGLPEDKNSNKRKVLICEFHKKIAHRDPRKGRVHPQMRLATIIEISFIFSVEKNKSKPIKSY